jgi:hypothetical protein
VRRIEIVNELVNDKILSLSEALGAYKVTIMQYVAYGILKNESYVFSDPNSLISFITSAADIVDVSHADLDPNTEKVISEMRSLNIAK